MMEKKVLTLQVSPGTIELLRDIAASRNIRVRRGPQSGQGSIAKLLDTLAREYQLENRP